MRATSAGSWVTSHRNKISGGNTQYSCQQPLRTQYFFVWVGSIPLDDKLNPETHVLLDTPNGPDRVGTNADDDDAAIRTVATAVVTFIFADVLSVVCKRKWQVLNKTKGSPLKLGLSVKVAIKVKVRQKSTLER